MQTTLALLPLTCRQIQLALFLLHHKGGNVVAPNCCALAYEADVLVLRKTGYVAEFEVKVSRADFKADFRKGLKHQLLVDGLHGTANEFSYACEHGLIRLDEVPAYAGLVYVRRHPRVEHVFVAEVVKKAPRLHKRLIPGLERRLAVSLMHRAFTNFSVAAP